MPTSASLNSDNDTFPEYFILTGLSRQSQVRAALFVIFLMLYLATVFGNGLIVILCIMDSRLHTPMYFFLGNLSFIDVCYCTSSVPQILVHCFQEPPTISSNRCLAQMRISLFLGMTECILLAVMAYDRFVAICSPLHYTLIMSPRLCIALAAFSWITSLLLTLIPSFTMKARLCGHNVIHHLSCEIRAVLKLACSDISTNVTFMSGSSVFTLLIPFSFILVTYGRIGLTILRMRSAQGRSKAFSTCGSHLTVVGIFYGTAIAMYTQPQTKAISESDIFVSTFYGVITPMLNPLIYSLRNKDVKAAVYRMMGREMKT
ncbi:olfactory receptor 13H1-like [Tiliqua scincoides]|uniref:olfactory receptor 13H1-like n=1 Tax=Tiliqua scincoides TaxID=71010 RepID=UPI003462FB12